jgi:hypothetical protein
MTSFITFETDLLLHVALVTVRYIFFKKRFIAQKRYTVCTRIDYKIFPFTSLNKYLNCDTSEEEMNINTSASNGREKQ